MTRTAQPADVRRTLRALMAASAWMLAFLVLAPATAAAAPATSSGVTDGTLRIFGGSSSDAIVLRLSPADPNQLQIDFGDDGSADETFSLSTFQAIEVIGGEGDDTVRIDQANGAFTTTKTTRIDGGNGEDILLGGSGAETLSGGNGDDVVDGNGGADVGDLGRGDDVFVWDPGDGSDVVEGSRGADTMVFNGAGGGEVMAATSNGDRVRFTRQPGSIVMDLDDVEVVDVRALGGPDSVTVGDVAGTDLQRVDVALAEALGGSVGDGQPDSVTVTGTDADDAFVAVANGSAVEVSGADAVVRLTGADPLVDRLVIDSGLGDDSVSIDPTVDALILVSVL